MAVLPVLLSLVEPSKTEEPDAKPAVGQRMTRVRASLKRPARPPAHKLESVAEALGDLPGENESEPEDGIVVARGIPAEKLARGSWQREQPAGADAANAASGPPSSTTGHIPGELSTAGMTTAQGISTVDINIQLPQILHVSEV